MVGGRGRGRSRAAPRDPSPAIGGASGSSPAPSVSAPSTAPSTVGGRRACEACEAAPGMPFCRVEWSFLCASCGPALHRNSWIVAVPPFPGPTPTNPGIAGAGTDPSQPPPHPYYLPPFMQMPPHMPPMHTPFQMPMPHVHPPNPNTTGAATKRRRRRPRVVSSSKEQVPDPAPVDTDTDPEHDRIGDSESVMHHGMKRKIRPQPPPSTRYT